MFEYRKSGQVAAREGVLSPADMDSEPKHELSRNLGTVDSVLAELSALSVLLEMAEGIGDPDSAKEACREAYQLSDLICDQVENLRDRIMKQLQSLDRTRR